jgi:hypothetical protein
MNNHSIIQRLSLLLFKIFFSFSIPSDEDIKEAFEKFFPLVEQLNIPLLTKRIKIILRKENRHLLNVFSLERDADVAKTIFKAIFASIYFKEIKLLI